MRFASLDLLPELLPIEINSKTNVPRYRYSCRGNVIFARCRDRVLKAIDGAREDALEIAVTGMDVFDITDFTDELTDAKNLLGLGIASPTMRKEVSKRLALMYLADLRQDVKDQIAAEIEQASGSGIPLSGTNGNG